MTTDRVREVTAYFSLFLILLLPFIGPYRYYNATGFMNEMLTMSCILLLVMSTVFFCKKITIPNYMIFFTISTIILVSTTFFNTTYSQSRLNLMIWLISALIVTICIFTIKYTVINHSVFKKKISQYMLYSSFITAAISFAVCYFSNPFAKLINISFYYNSYLRMDGFLGQPNLLAIILFLGVVSFFYRELGDNRGNILDYFFLFFISYCLFATLSRVAFIALIAFLGYNLMYGFFHKNLRKIMKFIITIALGYITYHLCHIHLLERAISEAWIPVSETDVLQTETVNYNRATNLDHKLDEIKRAFTVFIDHPIVGAGFGRYGYYSQQLTLTGWPVYIVGFPYHSHNIVAQVFAEFGSIGGIVLFLSIIVLIKIIISSYKDDSHIFLVGLCLIFGLNALFEYALWNFNFSIMFFILIAVFSNSKVYQFNILKTPILKVTYTLFFFVMALVLVSRWSIINELSRIFSKPENVVYAQALTNDRLMGLDFSYIYLSGIKYDNTINKIYEEEVLKVENWRPTDLVYYRKIQVNIANNNITDVKENMTKALLLGLELNSIDNLFKSDCKRNNETCVIARKYVRKLNKKAPL